MNRRTSLYLDSLRFGAAALVFLGHFSYTRFTGGHFTFLGPYRHDAVMVFFVLSGYVIAYVARGKERCLSEYAGARFARLYSVVLPVLAVGAVLDVIGLAHAPEVYSGRVAVSDFPLRLLANALFAQQLWFESVRYGSNGPLWSLGYEFWYYVLFGAAWYLSGWRRVAAVSAACAVAGPKILLLFPIWLLGVAVHRLHGRVRLGAGTAATLFVLPVVGYLWLRHSGFLIVLWQVSRSLGEAVVPGGLGFSRNFLGDYAVGLLVAANILSVPYLRLPRWARGGLPRAAESAIRGLASMTFTLYVFHFPLLCFLTAVGPFDPRRISHNLALWGAVWTLVFLVSRVSEAKKHVYRRLYDAAARGLIRHVARARP